MDPARIGIGRAPARAALAGNPSDGYAGAVVAVSVEAFAATARAVLVPAPAHAGDGADLVAATVRRFHRFPPVDALEARVRAEWVPAVTFQTTIPGLVGLAGSSAIVISVARALCDLYRYDEPDPVALARFALAVEVEEMGITAGLQDRLVQACGGLVSMDFSGSEPACEVLERGLLPALLVCWLPGSGASSGLVHGDLRARFDRGDPLVRASMDALARSARTAREAILAGDLHGLRRAVDASFDARARMMELDPRHVEMISAARAAGAAANYAGSGGAIVCVCDDARHRSVVERGMRSRGVLTVEV